MKIVILIVFAVASISLIFHRKPIEVPRALSSLPRQEIHLDQDDLDKRLKETMQSHPSREVSETFVQKIQSGEIALMYQSISGLVASVQTRWMPQSNRWQHILQVDPLALHSMDKTYLQLVLYHEFIHYLQRESEQDHEGKYYTADLRKYSEKKELFCQQKWYAEYEAYQRECALAAQMHTNVIAEFCVGFGTATFPSYIAGMLVKHDVGVDCQSVYQRFIQHSLM